MRLGGASGVSMARSISLKRRQMTGAVLVDGVDGRVFRLGDRLGLRVRRRRLGFRRERLDLDGRRLEIERRRLHALLDWDRRLPHGKGASPQLRDAPSRFG